MKYQHKLLFLGAMLCVPLATFAGGGDDYGRGNNHSSGTAVNVTANPKANADANATAKANANLNADLSNTNIVKIGPVEGGNAKAAVNLAPGAVQGGNASSSATIAPGAVKIEKGAIQANTNQKQGQDQQQSQQNANTLTNVGSPTISITSEAARAVAPAPNLPGSTAMAPPLFFVEGKPANAAGAHIVAAYLNNCRMQFGKNVSVREMHGKGASGSTQVIFVPHANYDAFGDKKKQSPEVVQTVVPQDLGEKGACMCLGLVQVETLDDKSFDASGLTPANDVGQFLADKLHGFSKVFFVAVDGSVSYNMSVEGNAKGAGIGGGVSNIARLFTSILGVSAEVNNGTTYPRGLPGGNFLVIAGEENPPDGSATVNLARFASDASARMNSGNTPPRDLLRKN